jgi:hypothetical protein
MIAAYACCVQIPDQVDGLYGIRTITNKIATAQHYIVTGLFCSPNAGFKGFYVGMDVTEDEIAHGVSCFACDSAKCWA